MHKKIFTTIMFVVGLLFTFFPLQMQGLLNYNNTSVTLAVGLILLGTSGFLFGGIGKLFSLASSMVLIELAIVVASNIPLNLSYLSVLYLFSLLFGIFALAPDLKMKLVTAVVFGIAFTAGYYMFLAPAFSLSTANYLIFGVTDATQLLVTWIGLNAVFFLLISTVFSNKPSGI